MILMWHETAQFHPAVKLVEQIPNGEFKNELDMDIILFGRSYRGKQVGPYCRLLEYDASEVIVLEDTPQGVRWKRR